MEILGSIKDRDKAVLIALVVQLLEPLNGLRTMIGNHSQIKLLKLQSLKEQTPLTISLCTLEKL